MALEDKLIINELRKRNREVFETVFRENYQPLVRFANNYVFDCHDSEDIVQSFFTSFWVNIDRLEIKTSIKSYFYRSVQNLCLNRIRDYKVYDKHKIMFLEGVLDAEDPEINETSDLIQQIHEALSLLPPAMYEVFGKRYLNGLSIKDIASEMNVSEGTVKTQLHRARKVLKNSILQSTNLFFFF
jgi:RNA polymerase sigma-70 factor (family 1)